MRKVILSLFALGCMSVAFANPVQPGTAAKVAQSFWSAQADAKSATELVRVEWEYSHIYLFAHPQGGYVMVAADDVARPVLGWSPDAAISVDNLAPQLRNWLRGYEREISNAIEARYMPPQSNADEWAALLAGIATKDGDDSGNTDLPATVSPLISTHWDQDEPYNDLCPEGENPYAGTPWADIFGSGNAPTGCVATAQAQVMKYWNWPPFGEGSHSYSTSDMADMIDPEMEQYGVVEFTDLSADFQHTLYDWSNMLNSYTSGGGSPWGGSSVSGTAEQKHAVAELMLHIGVSVQMIYGEQASGAFCSYPDTDYYCSFYSFKRDFRYDSTCLVSMHYDEIGSQTTWLNTMLGELAEGRPVLYGGGGDEGGHCFVCDGYDSQHRLHFNFGWGGQSDGYFAVSSIAPGGGGIGGGGYNFTENQEAVVGIRPLYACRLSDLYLHISADGADTSVLYMTNPTLSDLAAFASDQSWLTLADTAAVHGRMALHIDANPDAAVRQAVVTLTQGDEQLTLTVVQDGTDEVASISDADAAMLQAYPNPTVGRLLVKAEGLQRVQLLDLEGRTLLDQVSPMVDLSDMPAGVYLLRAVTDRGTFAKRIVRR